MKNSYFIVKHLPFYLTLLVEGIQHFDNARILFRMLRAINNNIYERIIEEEKETTRYYNGDDED